jgi:hypothetical protein
MRRRRVRAVKRVREAMQDQMRVERSQSAVSKETPRPVAKAM